MLSELWQKIVRARDCTMRFMSILKNFAKNPQKYAIMASDCNLVERGRAEQIAREDRKFNSASNGTNFRIGFHWLKKL